MNLEDVPVLTDILLEQYGLKAAGWRFDWGRGRNTFGTCFQGRRLIRISKPLAELNSEERVEETIRHEIAHALAGRGVRSHGPEWRAQCRVVGIEPKRCFSSANTVTPPRPPAPWVAVCPACRRSMPVRRLSRNLRLGLSSYVCPRCPGRQHLEIVPRAVRALAR